MTISLEQFSRRLAESGLISASDIDAALKTCTASSSGNAELLARMLVRRKKVTAYQARKIYHGNADHLVLGNYVILDKLGQGGMGRVYKARHRRMRRVVALKVLSPQITKSRNALARFQAEVRVAARLNHPNIVTAYDADKSSGRHFLVLEYVEGTDLAGRVRKYGTIPVEQAVDCVLQAARGLNYAHTRGIVHRDIKPSNLMLSVDGDVKILDMGLARFDSSKSQREQLTRVGQIIGTVDYMAPEQAFDASAADFRSDIYGLGAMFWYLLTGRTMYQGDNAIQILMAHQTRPIPSLCEAVSDATPALEAIFTRMVAKKPEERYSSMGEVIASLESPRIASAAVPAAVGLPAEDSRLSDFFRTLDESDSCLSIIPMTAREKKSSKTTVATFNNLIETDSAIDQLPPSLHASRGAACRSNRRDWLRIPPRWRSRVIAAAATFITFLLLIALLWCLS